MNDFEKTIFHISGGYTFTIIKDNSKDSGDQSTVIDNIEFLEPTELVN